MFLLDHPLATKPADAVLVIRRINIRDVALWSSKPIPTKEDAFALNEQKLPRLRVSHAAYAAALLTAAIHPAKAEHHARLKTGETLWVFAQRHHTTLRAVERLNHIHDPNALPNHMLLAIPAPPAGMWVHDTMHREAKVTADRVSVRMGPDDSYHRRDLVDSGTHALVVAQRDGWYQVRLNGDERGWIKGTFLHISGHVQQIAEKPTHHHYSRVASAKHHRVSISAARRHRIALAHLHNLRLREAHLRRLRALRLARVSHYHHAHERVAYAHEANWRARIVDRAYSYRGIPYVWGGANRRGFDCSGFTRYLYAKQGIHLPHNAAAQFDMGKHISRGNLKPGDLVFFHTISAGISHVGMYIGHGKFIHASSPELGGVRVDSLNEPYYRERYRGARRIVRH